ncbi:MAG: threonylcarbamoyl-AMP synthase, partial [Chloroflexi bacterium]|nr:threonylcarbamoyl-AMP synthase [Chloroflexota bacterium]
FIPAAIHAIFAAKQRPSNKSLPILLADMCDLPRVTRYVPTIAQQFINQYWPGPLTLILPKHPALPAEISDNDNIAVRVPNNPIARDIIRAAGGALAVTSANLSGHPATTTAAAALADLAGFVTAVVDDGPAPHTVPSTILDCSGDHLKILREGSISGQMLLGIAQPITL